MYSRNKWKCCISLLFPVHGKQKTARKSDLHWRTDPDGKYCLGCFFNLAHDKVMGSDPLASFLTPLQWSSASTTPHFWGSSVAGALKLVPGSGRLWFSWRFHGGDFTPHVLQEQRWRTVWGGDRVTHPRLAQGRRDFQQGKSLIASLKHWAGRSILIQNWFFPQGEVL